MAELRPTRIALAGDHDETGRWATALRGIEHVDLVRVPVGEDALLASLSDSAVDGMAFVAPLPDLARSMKRAMLAGRHVLAAGPAALPARQLHALAELAARRGRAVLVDAGVIGDEHLAFVRKMTAGSTPLWRPRYLRALRTGFPADVSLDAVVVTEIARVLAVAGMMPAMVSAWSPRIDDESGAADVAMVTLTFDGGPVARIDVSRVEPALRQELVVACDARTIVLRPLDREAPLRIDARGRHDGPKRSSGWAETVTEHPVGEHRDRTDAVAQLFVDAVRRRQADATSAADAGRAAVVWERARASMANDGQPVTVEPARDLPTRWAFSVIEGGGQGHHTHAAPRLTLVGRR